MAIQGNYSFKGFEVPNAYIAVNSVNFEVAHESIVNTEEDSIVWQKGLAAIYTADVYKDQAARTANPLDVLEKIQGNFTMAVNATAKNPVIQAYNALKAKDAYSDYTDV